MRRYDKSKHIEQANFLVEQRYLKSKGLITESGSNSNEKIDLANSNDVTGRNICDDFSTNSYEELINLINASHVSPEDLAKIQPLLDELKSDNNNLTNDLDKFNTYQHKISTILCR